MSKIENLLKMLPEVYDAAIIESPVNRRYYTGFPSSAGVLLLMREQSVLLIDFRYYEAAAKTVKDCQVVLLENFEKQVKEIFSRHRVKTILIETLETSVSRLHGLQKVLSNFEISESGDLSACIIAQRMKKTPDEINKIRQAQHITDEGFHYILNHIKEGVTEREIALDLEFFCRKRGAEGVAFDFIVVSGEKSALPHGVPGDRKLQKGDFITMDFGVVVDGLHSDMTRTVALSFVSDEQRRVYETVLKAQRAALDFVRPGVKCSEVDLLARRIIDEAGYEGCFGHSLGHGVGYEIHEEPRFGKGCDVRVQEGFVVTVEPGIYLPGRFGCRIEDMIVVTKDGTENLTGSTKELLIL